MSDSTPSSQSNTSRRPVGNLTLVAGAVALALAVGGVVLAQQGQPVPAAAPLNDAAVGLTAPVMPSFADVAERVSPAVVNVTVVSMGAGLPEGHPGIPNLQEDGPMGEFFRRFFEQPGGPGMPEGPGGSGRPKVQGAGSGFLVDGEGRIVTNYHVIEGASEVTVTLNDGSKFKAQVLGRDEKTDLALLKVEAGRPLPFVDLGNSSGTRVGDWVLAVGNPFGLGGSVNAGIVSARGRDINSGPYDDYIQIDAPINRGNSGGPLFDVYGRVIGVNTAIYSPSGGNVGIGFAIPAETVRDVIADLKADGRVERGWLGVQIQPVTEELASGLGLAGTDGVLVADVLPDGPSAGSELSAGDVILKAGGSPIKDYKDLPKLVAVTKAGTPMALELIRAGQPMTISVTVGRMPDDESASTGSSKSSAEPGQGRLGLYLAPLTPELRQERGLGDEARGVYVAQVDPRGPAAEAGIEAGTLISMVGGEAVTSPEQVTAAVKKALAEKRPALVLRIEQEGKPRFVAIPFAG